MVDERAAPIVRMAVTARWCQLQPRREWVADGTRRAFGASRRANLAPRRDQCGDIRQEGEPTGFGETGFASCLHPRGYHYHASCLERRKKCSAIRAIPQDEIAAPKGGDCDFNLLDEDFLDGKITPHRALRDVPEAVHPDLRPCGLSCPSDRGPWHRGRVFRAAEPGWDRL